MGPRDRERWGRHQWAVLGMEVNGAGRDLRSGRQYKAAVRPNQQCLELPSWEGLVTHDSPSGLLKPQEWAGPDGELPPCLQPLGTGTLPGGTPLSKQGITGGCCPLGNVPPFPTLTIFFLLVHARAEASDLWDSWLQDGLVGSQHLAVLPKAGHLWEQGRGYFKPECEKLALQRMKNFPEKGL